VLKQKAKKRAMEDAELRTKRGLPPPARVKWLPLD
jgi:hypothetical protein